MPWLIACAALVFHTGFGEVFRTPKLLAIAALTVPLIWRAKHWEVWRPGPALLVLWPLIGWIWILNAWDYLESILIWCVYVLVLCARPLGEKLREQLGRGLVLAGVGTVIYLVIQKLGLDPLSFEPDRNAGSFLGNPNAAAHFLLLCLCLGRFEGRFRIWAIGALFLGIVLTLSRGAWAGTLLWALVKCPQRWRVRLGGGLVLVLIIGVAVFQKDLRIGAWYATHPSAYVTQFKQQPSLIAERDPWFHGKRLSLMTRVILYRNSLVLAHDSALHGRGLGQFEVNYPRYAGAVVEDINMSHYYRARSAHNLLLGAVIQLGLPWLLLAMFLAVQFFLRTREDKQWWAAALIQGLIAMFSVNYLNPLIVAPLLLTAPAVPTRAVSASRRWLVLLLLVPVVLIAWLDVNPSREHRIFFPERRAARFYNQESPNQAWHWQASAWKQDPYGPETLTNMGLICDARGGEFPAMEELADGCFAYVAARYPNYLPARRHLQRRLGETQANEYIRQVNQHHETFFLALKDAITGRGFLQLPPSMRNR